MAALAGRAEAHAKASANRAEVNLGLNNMVIGPRSLIVRCSLSIRTKIARTPYAPLRVPYIALTPGYTIVQFREFSKRAVKTMKFIGELNQLPRPVTVAQNAK